MTKIDIFSGFLGAGKTTLIKKLIAEAYAGEKLVLIENEFGEIAIDGGFLQDAGIQITEMSQGCICCSLVGDFGEALTKVIDEFHPDRILIEPSGVGKLSDVIRAVQNLGMEEVELNSFTTVADAKKCKMYSRNFGEFYNDQIGHANSIVLSRTADMTEAKLDECVALLRESNSVATIITTPWEEVTGAQILEAMEHKSTLTEELKQLAAETAAMHEDEECDDPECECHHHHHDHDEECECEHEHHHHHHHDEEECDDPECECHHHHHDHDEECECEHEHHHHHHHDEEECDDPECECHHHHHDHDEECECEHERHHHHH
ncbi:MAG: GTP-binding protein, partial [Lachnospiraceae bacterium]|nr:GTP-binding protein [Lachnospiraceae bacterium]